LARIGRISETLSISRPISASGQPALNRPHGTIPISRGLAVCYPIVETKLKGGVVRLGKSFRSAGELDSPQRFAERGASTSNNPRLEKVEPRKLRPRLKQETTRSSVEPRSSRVCFENRTTDPVDHRDMSWYEFFKSGLRFPITLLIKLTEQVGIVRLAERRGYRPRLNSIEETNEPTCTHEQRSLARVSAHSDTSALLGN